MQAVSSQQGMRRVASPPAIRYAVGTTLIMAVAMGFDYTLAYITPVLALGFLAPGAPPVSARLGVGFITVFGIICMLGVYFSHLFLDYPLVFLPLLALALFHVYYNHALNKTIKLFFIIAFVVIPLLSMQSTKLGAIVAANLLMNAMIAIALVWVVFLFFPNTDNARQGLDSGADAIPSSTARFVMAMNRLIIVLPLLILFFVYQWYDSLLVLMFVMILSLNPVTASFKSGAILIAANLAGGIVAIVAYDLLVIVPEFMYLILLTLLAGLIMGNKVFAGTQVAPLYNTAFSTFLLVLGSVTASEGAAGAKVWSRIFQIGAAVVYLVVASGLLAHWTKSHLIKHDYGTLQNK